MDKHTSTKGDRLSGIIIVLCITFMISIFIMASCERDRYAKNLEVGRQSESLRNADEGTER